MQQAPHQTPARRESHYSTIPLFNYSIIQLQYSTIPLFNYSIIQLFHYSTYQLLFNYSNYSTFQLFHYLPVFHYSTIPLFHFWTILLFYYSTIPFFNYSIIQLFHYSTFQLFHYGHNGVKELGQLSTSWRCKEIIENVGFEGKSSRGRFLQHDYCPNIDKIPTVIKPWHKAQKWRNRQSRLTMSKSRTNDSVVSSQQRWCSRWGTAGRGQRCVAGVVPTSTGAVASSPTSSRLWIPIFWWPTCLHCSCRWTIPFAQHRRRAAAYKASTLQLLHYSTIYLLVFHYSTIQLFNYSTIPLLNYSTIPLLNYSTFQLFHYSTIPLINYSIIQLFHYSTFQLLLNYSNYSIIPLYHYSTIPLFTGIPLFHYSIIPLFHHSTIPLRTIQLFHYSTIPLFHYSIIQLFHFSTIPFFHFSTREPLEV